MRPTILRLAVACAVLGAPGAGGQMVVVPNGLELIVGNLGNSFPFQCKAESYQSMRYQQVYAGDEIGAGLIGEMRLRQDGTATDWTSVIGAVTITLSSTTAAPDGLSSAFDDNVGVDATEVWSGPLVLSNVASLELPSPFTIVVPFRRSFSFDPSGGMNLLIDVTIPTRLPEMAVAHSFDAEDTLGDSVSRLYAAVGSSGGTANTLGLVTKFHFHVFADGFESGDTSAWTAATMRSMIERKSCEPGL